ncbi:tyrosine-type recombinase/integrase [Brevundimonas sp.]|uniref:tyrosine-type recombinase/integrase n=1 Tax=Brevundimonas sp. TaxID=1871086 RepID=UPI0035648E7E
MVVKSHLPKGIKRVVRRSPTSEVLGTYWYAWKGGPRLPGQPGSREFMLAYSQAVKNQRGQPDDTLGALALQYQASPEFAGLAESTQKEWRRRISKIAVDSHPLDIGGIPLAALNDPRVKSDLLAWRDQWQETPRAADYLMQVLSRILSWGQQRGLLAANAATGVGQLYKNNRSDQVWTADDLARFAKAASSPEIACVAQLACLLGLRLHDLTTLLWTEVTDVAVIKVTRKGRGKRTAVIPLLAETRSLLAQIKSQQKLRHGELTRQAMARGEEPPTLPLTVLSNTLGRPWKYSGLVTRFNDTRAAAQPPIEKHLHDARGTLATRLRKAGLTAPEIADVLGWEESRVERLLAVYVDRTTVVTSIAERIQRLEAEAAGHDQGSRHLDDVAVLADWHLQPMKKGGGVVHHVDFRRGASALPTKQKPDKARFQGSIRLVPKAEGPTMKRALIDLCAYLGAEGVERRSTLVSDVWLAAEIARDPWLFRVVDVEPGYHELHPSQSVRCPIPESVAIRMSDCLKQTHR